MRSELGAGSEEAVRILPGEAIAAGPGTPWSGPGPTCARPTFAGDRPVLQGCRRPERLGGAVGPGRDVAARDAGGAGGERGPDDDSVLAADRHVEAVVVTARARDRAGTGGGIELHAAVVADEAHRGREARAGAGGRVRVLEDVPLAV